MAEFENMFWLFAVAGNETLRNGLPGACIALLEHPRAQAELRADPALLPVAVDEMLRWWTPVMTFRRTATADCELGGQPIRAGDKVVVSFTSANRDEAVFGDPDRFDIRRQPNPHLVFGHGPHFCLGAHLARVQMRALFAEVLARTSALRSAGRAVLPALELPARRQAAAGRLDRRLTLPARFFQPAFPPVTGPVAWVRLLEGRSRAPVISRGQPQLPRLSRGPAPVPVPPRPPGPRHP